MQTFNTLFGRRELRPILQNEAAECGLASLGMIANWYGHDLSLAALRRRFSLSLKGATLDRMINMADQLGLAARPLRLELCELGELSTPCILHWNLNHFVVLKKVTRSGAVILNPARGLQTLTHEEISRHFTGVALEFTRNDTFHAVQENGQLRLRDLWPLFRDARSILWKILGLSCLLQVLTLIAPFYTQLVVDDVLLSGDIDLLTILAAGFTASVLIQVIIGALRSLALVYMNTQLDFRLVGSLFRHLLRLPMDYFEKRHLGDTLSRFGALHEIKQLLTHGVSETLLDCVLATTTLAVLLVYSPALTGLILGFLLLYLVIRLAAYYPLRRLSEEQIIASAREDSTFMETVRGVQAIKLYGKESDRVSVWQNRYVELLNLDVKAAKFGIGFSSVQGLLSGIERVIVIWLAAKLVLAQEFSVGMLYAFLSYQAIFSGRVMNLIDRTIQLRMMSLHLARLSDIALTKPEKLENTGSLFSEFSGALQVRNLGARYSDNDPWVFRNIEFSINAGESVAIIGKSGMGKTTLLKHLLGLMQPREGEVMVERQPLLRFGLANYRKQVAAVMQDDQLFSGSLTDNISLFAPEPDMSWLIECARAAHIHEEIMAMPMGYDSLVGDMGTSLSGGQRQRVLLARALYQRPKILFLDEATSHLDTELENAVNFALKQLSITRIVIAHRPETIASCDRVIDLAKSGFFRSPPHLAASTA